MIQFLTIQNYVELEIFKMVLISSETGLHRPKNQFAVL